VKGISRLSKASTIKFNRFHRLFQNWVTRSDRVDACLSLLECNDVWDFGLLPFALGWDFF
jgi:hypothetical protein